MPAEAAPRTEIVEFQRNRELEAFDDAYKRLFADPLGFFGLNFFAPPGFGRTVLLRQIAGRYSDKQPVSLLHLGDPAAWRPFGRERFLRQVLADLIAGLPPKLTQGAETVVDEGDLPALTEWVGKLAGAATAYDRPCLILVDDYDDLPASERDWFESEFLGVLIGKARFGVALTSRTELHFDRLDLRMKFQAYALSQLDAQEISAAAEGYRPIARELCRMSGGVPVLAEGLIGELEREGVTVADFSARLAGISDRYYRDYVEKVLLKSIPADLVETTLVFALLRRFDVTSLRNILPARLHAYEGASTPTYLNLIERLRSWIKWRPQGGYELNSGISMALRGYVMDRRPQDYLATNEVARAAFVAQLQKRFSEPYLLEMLFHTLMLKLIKNGLSEQVLRTEISETLLAALPAPGSLSTDEATALLEALNTDPDLAPYLTEGAKDRVRSLSERPPSAFPQAGAEAAYS